MLSSKSQFPRDQLALSKLLNLSVLFFETEMNTISFFSGAKD